MLGVAIMLLAAVAVGSVHVIGMTNNVQGNKYEIIPAPDKLKDH